MLSEILLVSSSVATPTYLVVCLRCRSAILRPWRKWSPARVESAKTTPEADTSIKQGASKELAVPEPDKPVYETFDHPTPPIPLLGASLPTAPMGFGWEISTPSVNGDPVLRLTLLQLSTSLEVESVEGNLIVARRWKYANDETYAELYRKVERNRLQEWRVLVEARWDRRNYYPGDYFAEEYYPEPSSEILKLQGKVMMANLITPMVDWARQITLRYIVEHPDESKINYMLIESPVKPEKEKVPA